MCVDQAPTTAVRRTWLPVKLLALTGHGLCELRSRDGPNRFQPWVLLSYLSGLAFLPYYVSPPPLGIF